MAVSLTREQDDQKLAMSSGIFTGWANLVGPIATETPLSTTSLHAHDATEVTVVGKQSFS